MKYRIGIDEAGRGPLAGPVAVGAVIVPGDFDWKFAEGVRDSKKLTVPARETWYRTLSALRKAGDLDFAVSFSSSAMIDRRGIVFAVQSALARCLKVLEAQPPKCEIFLDGSLYAPKEFTMQKTIIRGDESEPIISLASIAAKVTRDRLMTRLAPRYPAYDFDVHKGYATRSHRNVIAQRGLSDIHRASFCSRLRVPAKSV
jgi:ribonuclease HII